MTTFTTTAYRLYAGYDTGPEPPFMICSLQASLVYAMPVMSAVSLTALVFHLWICLRGSMNQTIMTRSREIQWAVSPSHSQLTVVPTYPIKPSARRPPLPPRTSLHHRPRLASGPEPKPGHSPAHRLRVFLQCGLPPPVSAPYRQTRSLAHSARSRTGVAASVVVFLVLLLVAEFLVARIFYRNWKSVRTVKIYGWSSANLVARIALFTLYVFTGIV